MSDYFSTYSWNERGAGEDESYFQMKSAAQDAVEEVLGEPEDDVLEAEKGTAETGKCTEQIFPYPDGGVRLEHGYDVFPGGRPHFVSVEIWGLDEDDRHEALCEALEDAGF